MVRGALDEANEFKHVSEEDFDLRFVLEKLGCELPRNDMSIEESLKYVELKKENNSLRSLYNVSSMLVCTVSPTISLIGLLMIAIQTPGLINLFYIVFCLTNIYQSKNFLYQKDWNLPKSLKRYLKPFLFMEICLQTLYQIPIEALHSGAGQGGWQDTIGLFRIWEFDAQGNVSSVNVYQILYKCFMYSIMMVQEAVFESNAFKEFVTARLPMYRILSTMKAQASAFLFNNNKIRNVIVTKNEKSVLMRKLQIVQK
jgi:hypothetical protein